MKKTWLAILVLITGIGCAPAPKAPVKKVEAPKKDYPYVVWRKRVDGPFSVIGMSRRRVFVMEKSQGYAVKAFNKKTGRLHWSWQVQPALASESDPWSFQAAVAGRTVAVWTKDDKIRAMEKYRGVEVWESAVDGMGLAVLGVNFVTAWKNNIRLIEPDSGKVTDYPLEREISAPVVVTPKGYLAVMMGEELLLVDLTDDKAVVKKRYRLDLTGAFEPGRPLATEGSVLLYQKTIPEEEFLVVRSIDASTFQDRWTQRLRGRVPVIKKAFQPFADGSGMVTSVSSMTTREHYWKFISADGKTVRRLVRDSLAPAECVLGSPISFCPTDKGVEAYDTTTWKKLWFRETIYPVDGLKHAFVGKNIILAAGVRVKGLSPKGDTLFALDVKARGLKDPRAVAILGSRDNVAFVAVVDSAMGSKRDAGEIWAVDTASGKLLWRAKVGKAKVVRTSVLLMPEQDAIFVANSSKLLKISMKNGRVVRRSHGLRNIKKAEVTGYDRWVAVIAGDRVSVFDVTRMKKLRTLKITGRIPVGLVPGFFLTLDSASKKLVAMDLKKGRDAWSVEHVPFSMKPSLFINGSSKSALLVSYQGSMTLDLVGHNSQTLLGAMKAVKVGSFIVLVMKETAKPTLSWRIQAYPYEEGDKVLWTADSSKYGNMLSWLRTTVDYVLIPGPDSKGIVALAGDTGEVAFKTDSRKIASPVVSFRDRFAFTTGTPGPDGGVFALDVAGRVKPLFKARRSPLGLRSKVKLEGSTLYLLEGDSVIEAVRVSD